MENPRLTRAWKPQSLNNGARKPHECGSFWRKRAFRWPGGRSCRLPFATVHFMLLQTGCYQVGSDGGSSIGDAFTNMPGWQRWMKFDRRCFYKPDVTRLAATRLSARMKLHRRCFYKPDVTRLAAMGANPR